MAKFSYAENLGIAMMSGGIAFGFYFSIVSAHTLSIATSGFANFLGGEVQLDQIKTALRDTTGGLELSSLQTGYSHIGFWVFLLGFMIFTISRRAKFNSDLTSPPE